MKRKPKPTNKLAKKFTQDMHWSNDIQAKLKLGYSYKDAYALVSRDKIRQLFEEDVRIERE